MTDFDLHGPWTGAALRPSVPYRIRKRRAWTRAFLVIAGVLAFIGGALAGLSRA